MNAIHQLDLVRAMTGLRARRVAALTSRGAAGVEVEDAAVAVIDWGDGVVGSLVAAAHAPGASDDETIEIDAKGGAIRLGDPYADRPVLDRFLRRPVGDDRAGQWLRSAPAPIDPWLAAVDGFAASVRAGRPPVPGIDDAEAALAIVLAIYRSARTGRFETVRPSGDSLSRSASPGG
jgi:predicted dehydrogenase